MNEGERKKMNLIAKVQANGNASPESELPSAKTTLTQLPVMKVGEAGVNGNSQGASSGGLTA